MRIASAIAVAVYLFGFILVFGFHAVALQMVTPGLAALRAAVWPITVVTGWTVRGRPLPMD